MRTSGGRGVFSNFGHPRTTGGGGSKKGKFLRTSFMDGPLSTLCARLLRSTRGVRPCYGPLFDPARAKEKGDHNMGAQRCLKLFFEIIYNVSTRTKSIAYNFRKSSNYVLISKVRRKVRRIFPCTPRAPSRDFKSIGGSDNVRQCSRARSVRKHLVR